MPNQTRALVKRTISFSLLGIFTLYILLSNFPLQNYFSLSVVNESTDFSRYVHSRTLSLPARRIIIVGDIHGQYDYFQDLLSKLLYDSSASKDVLIHTGDILAKGTVSDSLGVLDWMASRSIIGVRGNHDQKVIDWKGWQDWIRRSKDGRTWLDNLEHSWEEHTRNLVVEEEEIHADNWVDKQRKKSRKADKKWWDKVPKGWKLFHQHYLIASSLTPSQYSYLLSLPLILHLPSDHIFVAHAGLLPSDPTRSPLSHHQPLSHLPDAPKIDVVKKNGTLRMLQEVALLTEIPQNNDPWIVLNMRSLLDDNTVTRGSKKGRPWSPDWNSMMERCSGYDNFDAPKRTDDPLNSPLPCLPSTIIYGHAASRGLDMKRWSFGLDSGCVYGRRLTALVLQSSARSHSLMLDEFLDYDDEDVYDEDDDNHDDNSDDLKPRKRSVRFGDDDEQSAEAYLVNVRCR